MKRILLILCFVFGISSSAYGIGKTIVDDCSFTVSSTVALNVSNTGCETPGGSTTWTEQQDDCTGTMEIDASFDRVHTTTSYANCILLYKAPVNADGLAHAVDVIAAFRDLGTVATGDSQGIWAGTSSANFYSITSVDDGGGAYKVYKRVSSVNTSLGTFGAFSNTNFDVVILRVRPYIGVFGYEGVDGVANFANAGDDALNPSIAGLGCGELQRTNDDCAANSVLGFDDFSVTVHQQKWSITSWLFDVISVDEAVAQDVVRTGRWYITPVIHDANGNRIPKVDIYEDPGAPLLDDDFGNPTMPNKCKYSANIGSQDVPNEWALVYTVCEDYSNIDADSANILVLDESVNSLTKPLSTFSTKDRTAFKREVETKTGKLSLSDSVSVGEWLKVLGKQINKNFSPVNMYTK